MKLNVLQKFTLLSVGATIVVAVGMGVLVSVVLSRNLLSREAQVTAEALRTVTNVDLPPEIFARAVRENDEAHFRYIWGHMRQLPEVFRMKLYDTKGKVVWSDEPRLIGLVFTGNEGLEKALHGDVAVEMGMQKPEHEFEKALVPEGEILELYVPLISPSDNSVYAVLEIYKHPTAFLANRHYWLGIIWAGTSGSGMVIFLALFGLFKGALREQNRLHKIERQYLEVELEMKAAGAIQKRLLPQVLPTLPGYVLAAFHQPSREIGGDYYDAYLLADGTLCLVIADNMGNGIPGALLMADTHIVMSVRNATLSKVSDVMRTANRSINSTAPPGGFVTGIFAKLVPLTRHLTYSNAGHPPGLVARRGQMISLDKGGLPLGVEPEEDYEQDETVLEPGDVLFLYTDGLIEAMNAKDEQFGEERLKLVLADAASSQDPEAVIRVVLRAVDAFRSGVEHRDDVAILCTVVT